MIRFKSFFTQKDFSFTLTFLLTFLIVLILSIFALRFDPEVRDLEGGVYDQLTESFVEDGDLNIANQLPEYRRKIITKSFNHPDLHDHGVVALWYPVYLYSKLLKKSGVSLDYFKRVSYRSSMVLINVFMMLCILVLSYKTLIFTNRQMSWTNLAFITFGTPLYWYGLIHPSTSDVTSAIFPFIYFYIYSLCIEDNKKELWFLYGIVVALGVVVKVSLLFYYIIPFHYLYLRRKEFWQAFKDSVPYFSIGSLCVGGLFFTNEYLKYGQLHYAYTGIVSKYSVLFELTFGPAGFFVVSPIYLLVLVSVVYILVSKKFEENSFWLLMLIAPILKILTESYNFSGNGDYGGRHLITDHFILLMLYPAIYLRQKKMILFLRVIATLFVFQCLYMGWVFFDGIGGAEFNWGVNYATSFKYITNNIDRVSYFIQNVLDGFSVEQLKSLVKYFPLFTFFSLLLSLLITMDLDNKKVRTQVLTYLISAILINYLIVTSFNLLNNKSNAQDYIALGMFEKSVIVDGSEAFHFDDNVGNILMHIRLSELRKDYKSKKLAENALQEYYKRVQEQIVIDPVGFREQLLSGEVEFYNPFY